MGHICMGHRDDSFLLGYEYTACTRNVQDTVDAFQKMGFVIHPVKSVFIPTQEIEFLGFLLNSILMTIRLPPTKAAHVRRTCQTLLLKTEMTIRETAQVIGLIVSSLTAVQFGELYYRNLEKNKVLALQARKGNYDAPLYLSKDATADLSWWINNVDFSFKKIVQPTPDMTLTTDASTKGWGAVYGEQKTGGPWSLEEQGLHINYLELKAIWLGLKSLCNNLRQKHIRIQSDNTTAVAYINAMGGIKSADCNNMAQQIWLWCIEREIWLSVCHIPDSMNMEADSESRVFSTSTEWSLHPEVFDHINEMWGPFEIYLFASRLNFKIPTYVSWKPDPDAKYVNALFMQWEKYYFYTFPPFSLIATATFILQSRSNGMQKQYKPHIKQWIDFCCE